MTFLWDTVYFRSLSTRLLPIEFEIETFSLFAGIQKFIIFALYILMRRTCDFFWHTSLRQYVTLPEAPLLFRSLKENASLGQICHLAKCVTWTNVSLGQCVTMLLGFYPLNLIFQKLKPNLSFKTTSKFGEDVVKFYEKNLFH